MIEAKYLRSQKNLYFLGLYKSLRVVSKFMDLEWCRREKNQIPPRSAWTNIEFGLITFFVFKFLSHKLSNYPSAWFSILLDRRRMWSDHIFIFQTFVTQTFEWSLGLISILLENENVGNPENQPKWLASSLILNKLFDKNGCNQHLCFVEPIVMVYLIFNDDQV